MPSFEADVVLRALIVDEVCIKVGPSYWGSMACAEAAVELDVSKEQLWGSICNMRSTGLVEDIRMPVSPGFVALVPTSKGERYFKRSARKQPYPRERCRISSPVQPEQAFALS